GSGQKDTLELAPIFERYAALFTLEQVHALRARLDEARDPGERESVRRLHAFALDEHIQARLRPMTEELAARQGKATVRWRGEDVPYAQVATRLRTLPTREERGELFAARGAVERGMDPLRARMWQETWSARRGVGDASDLERAGAPTGMPLRGLAAEMRQFLEDSRSLLEGPLDEYCMARTGVGLAQCTQADMPFLFRPTSDDPLFAAGRLLIRLEIWTS